MRSWFLISFLLATTVALVECSNHSRTVGTQVTPEEVFSRLAEFTTQDGERSQQFSDLAHAKGSVVYYSRAPGPFGQIKNVAAINDYRALGFDVDSKDVTDVELFFVDNANSQPRFALLMAVKRKDHDYNTQIFMAVDSETRIAKSKLEVKLLDDDATEPHVLRIKSTDVDPAQHLQGVIQMKLSNAEGKNLGKFPTLAGYAQ